MSTRLTNRFSPRDQQRRVPGLAGLTCLACALFLSACEDRAAKPAGPPPTPKFAIESTDDNAVADEKNPQVVRGNTMEDFHYAFTINRPSEDWLFVKEKEARKSFPDAAALMVNPKLGGYLAVVTEELEIDSITAYVDFLDASLGTDNRRNVTTLPVKVSGHDAIMRKFEQEEEGLWFEYHALYTKRGRMCYQFIGWGKVGDTPRLFRDLETILKSVTFVEDRQPVVRQFLDSDDALAADWRIVSNVYENASYGFRLRQKHGLRLWGVTDLADPDLDAAAGLGKESPTLYQNYIVQRIGDTPAETFNRYIIDIVEADLGIDDAEPESKQVQVAGQQATQLIYRNVDTEGVQFDFAETVFVRNGVSYRLHSYWPSSQAESSEPQLALSYECLEWLTEPERVKLEQQIGKEFASNFVRPQQSMRRGVFRNFEYGFSYKLPPGLWTAQPMEDDLTASLERDGITLQVLAEPFQGDAAAYHNALLGAYETQNIPTRTVEHNGTTLRVSAFDEPDGDLTFSYRIGSAGRNGKFVQVFASTLLANKAELDRVWQDAVKGLDLDGASGKPIVRDGKSVTDYRVGYSLQTPPGWKGQQRANPNIDLFGSVISSEDRRGRTACIAMAICLHDLTFDPNLIIEAMLRQPQFGVDFSTRRETASKLAGRDAQLITFDGKIGSERLSAGAWVMSRDRTIYLLLVVAPENDFRNPAAFSGRFRLVD